MRTILIGDTFYEICPRCGLGAHCYMSGGDTRRCRKYKDRLRFALSEAFGFDTEGKFRGDW